MEETINERVSKESLKKEVFEILEVLLFSLQND